MPPKSLGGSFLIIFKCSIREPKITSATLKLHLPGNDSKHPSEHSCSSNVPQHSAARTLAVASEPQPALHPHLAQTLTHIRAAMVFLSTSCHSHFSPYLKFKTFFSFTIKFKLSQFEAQRKHRAKKHTAQN